MYSRPWGQKMESTQKFLQVKTNEICMPTNLVGMASLVLELWLTIACLQKWPKFPFGHESVHAWVRAGI